MSHVTNAILSLPILEDEKFVLLNHLLQGKLTNGQSFGDQLDIGNAPVGGRKNLEASIYIAAFNGVDVDELIKCIKSIVWDDCHEVQLFIKDQHDEVFTERLHAVADESESER